jgi:hypothetical protein
MLRYQDEEERVRKRPSGSKRCRSHSPGSPSLPPSLPPSLLSGQLLNLLLVGKGVSNVFDGDKELGDSGEEGGREGERVLKCPSTT